MKLIQFTICCLGLLLLFPPVSAGTVSHEQRVETLLATMTLVEKLGQLQQLDGFSEGGFRKEHLELARQGRLGSTLNVRGARVVNELQRAAVEGSRLGIPILFAFDVIHGYRTIFPVPLAEASAWDPDLAERTAAVAAAEAAAAGLKWTFAPMVDIARDPRWGRIVEGAGEDPFLGSAYARARVYGFQGKDPSEPDKILACAKHWVGYGAAEGGRDYAGVELSASSLRNIYYPPFRAALEAGVATFMSAFNDLNGVPTSGNASTLTSVLRREWGFSGFVVSDYTSVLELVAHGFAPSGAEAARLALTAGVEMEMVSRTYAENLENLVTSGAVPLSVIDEAVRRILRWKFRLGLFDHPYADEQREAETLARPEFRVLAREAAVRSLVLLKNEGGVLPFPKNLRSLAVIGSLADDRLSAMGSWSGDGRADDVLTLLAALRAREKLGGPHITYAGGGDVSGTTDAQLAEAVRTAKRADAVTVVLGESAAQSGEAASRAFIGLPGRQLDVLRAILALGKPTAVVLLNGRPLAIPEVATLAPAILEAWFGGLESGPAIVAALFGEVDPSGKLPAAFPHCSGQPAYYGRKSTGRPAGTDKYTSKYLDCPDGALFPFGHGLSYTTFALADLTLSSQSLRPDEKVTLEVEVRNVGPRAGTEVVQVYVRDLAASRTRPVRELKGFQRVSLETGEHRRVNFTLGAEAFGFYQDDGRFLVEPGQFLIYVGNSSIGGLETALTMLPARP